MKIFYLDETGNTGAKADPEQPLHIIGALIIDADQARNMERALIDIAHDKFGGKSAENAFEFKGSDIRSGKGDFAEMRPDERIELVHEIVALLKKFDAQFTYFGIDKEKQPSSRHPHDLAFMFLAESAQDMLQPKNEYGLIIADEGSGLDEYLIQKMHSYKRNNTGWGYRPTQIDNIIGAIHYVDSQDDWLVQLSDILTHFVMRRERHWRAFIKQKDSGRFDDWAAASHISIQADIAIYKAIGPKRKIYP